MEYQRVLSKIFLFQKMCNNAFYQGMLVRLKILLFHFAPLTENFPFSSKPAPTTTQEIMKRAENFAFSAENAVLNIQEVTKRAKRAENFSF